MLAMADSKGRVWASVPGLANRARISVEAAREAISTFLSPDPDSRTPDHEGRRIEPIDGGWRLLNHEKYRTIRDEESVKESKRRYINNRREMERKQSSTISTVDRSRDNAEAEAEASKPYPPSEEGKTGKPVCPPCPIEEIIKVYHEALPTNPRFRVRNATRDGYIRSRWQQFYQAGDFKDKEKGLQCFRWFFDERVKPSKFLTGQAEARNGSKPFIADLEWLMRPTNFAKVIEGKYQ